MTISFISGFNTLYQNTKRINQLENSDYVSSHIQSTGSLYGYDDDKNGLINRIEEVGIIPFKTGTPAFRIERTHQPADNDYNWYALRLEKLGTHK